jgi:predicted ATPase/class 3 adenylate cyclase
VLPTGTITFLFTDIEGSTRILQGLGDRYREVLETHDRLIREAVAQAGGTEVRTEGDAFFVVFPTALAAVEAVGAAQRALARQAWPEGFEVRVRMGLHTGEGVPGGGDYIGLDVHRAARVAAAAHGGQVVLSQATAALVEGRLPAGAHLRDLGRHRLKDLAQAEHLHQLVIDGVPADFPPLRTLDAGLHRLPLQLTSFVGREREVKEVTALLAASRLLTLTGPGGTGKTRLALQVAADSAAAYEDGVLFVPLEPIRDPSLVPATLASVLGLPPSPVETNQRLIEYLADKQMLLILDNLEQALGAAGMIASWLQAPGVSLLATSRAPLRVTGEREYAVPPLGLPEAAHLPTPELLISHEAVALFVERAMAARSDFRLTDANASAVAAIVTRLDGLPLAIELAAARVRLLSPAALLARLSSALGLLTGGSRDLPARQQTLRGAISWSHDLLDPTSARVFARLAVFWGGCTFEAVEWVCGEPEIDVLAAIETLVDHSLLRRIDQGGDLRLVMLETIREFAGEKLSGSGEREAVRERHAGHYLSVVEEAAPNLVRESARSYLDRLEVEINNTRQALGWAVETGQGEVAQRMVAALWRFWQMRGYLHQGREWCRRALGLDPTPPLVRLRALEAAGGLAYWQADNEVARGYYQEALDLARSLGDDREVSRALYNYGFALGIGEDLNITEAGIPFMTESLEIGRRLGDPQLIGNALWGLASAWCLHGVHSKALPLFDEAFPYLHQAMDRFMLGWNHRMRGVCRLETGDVEGARADFEAGLAIFYPAGDVSALALHVRDFAALALVAGDDERALRLAGAMGAIAKVSETNVLAIVRNQLPELAGAVARVGEERAEKLLAEGQALSTVEAVEYATT